MSSKYFGQILIIKRSIFDSQNLMKTHRKRKKEVASEVGLDTNIFPLISLNLWLAGSKLSESWLVYKIS